MRHDNRILSLRIILIYYFIVLFSISNLHVSSERQTVPNVFTDIRSLDRSDDSHVLLAKNTLSENRSNRQKKSKSRKTAPKKEINSKNIDYDYNKGKSESAATKSADAAMKVTSSLLSLSKKTVKVGLDFLAGKHVTVEDISGKWKIEQEVEIKEDVIINCPATIHLMENGTVETYFEDKQYHTTFILTEKSWPLACRIEFEAYAFQSPYDKEPVLMKYKGYFKRSLLNPRVLLIRGRIYRTVKKSL